MPLPLYGMGACPLNLAVNEIEAVHYYFLVL